MKDEAKRKASQLRYRKAKTAQIVLQFVKKDKELIDQYCHSINTPTATWIKSLIFREINCEEYTSLTVAGEAPDDDSTP